MYINRRKVKQIVAHTTGYFSAIKRNYLHVHKQQNNMAGSQKHTVRKKSDLKELIHIVWFHLYEVQEEAKPNTGSLWGSGPLTKNTREPSELPEMVYI